MTNKLKYGQENTVAVYANTGEPKQSRWYTGGGLFRDVSLIYTDAQLYFLRHPLYITTTDNKTVHITANVQCHTKQNTVAMRVIVTSPDGKEVKNEVYKVKRNRNYKRGQDDNCIGFYFGEPTFIFLQPLGDLDLSENRFLSQSFTDMFINWLRIR